MTRNRTVALLLVSVTTALALPAASAAPLSRVLKDPAIVESSGLARSTYPRPVLWTHNDSGDVARVFAVGRAGRTRAELRLKCAGALDWEDISTGPRHTIWVGDIGNNAGNRSLIQVYRFTEPRALESGMVRCKRYDLVFPDGPRNAEALFVHPRSGRLWIASKQAGGAGIYRGPRRLSASEPNRLRLMASAPTMATAGTWHPSGKRFALSSGAKAYVYRRKSLRLISVVPLPATRQGESLEYNRGGTALFRGSEGAQSPVYRVRLP